MNNNLILKVRSFKKALLGITFTIISFLPINGKNISSAAQIPAEQVQRTRPSAVQIPAVRTDVPTSRTRVSANQAATVTTPQLSNLAIYGLKNNTTTNSLQNFLNTNESDLTSDDVKIIRERLAVMSKAERAYARSEAEMKKDELINFLKDEIQRQTALINQLMQINKREPQKGWFSSLTDYESYIAQYLTPGALTAGVTAAGVSLAAFGAGATAMVALPVAAGVYGLDRLASYVNTGAVSISEKINKVENFLGQQLSDLGKYPTFNSRIAATYEDFINTTIGSKNVIPQNIYNAALKQLKETLIRERDMIFKAKDGEEAREKALDMEIAALQSQYNKNKNDLNGYLNRLKTINLNNADVNKCRALVSEFLRTESNIALQATIEERTLGQETITPALATVETSQPSWYSEWFGE